MIVVSSMQPHASHPIGLTPAPGEILDGSLFGPENHCFACSPDHPHGFHLRFTVEGDEVVTRMTPGPTHEGPTSMMHGGLVTTLADEIAVWALIALRGKFGFTAAMNSRFVSPTRLGKETVARARIVRDSTRITYVEARILQDDGATVCFTSEMSFVVPDVAGAEKMLGTKMPEDWKKFFR